MLIWLDETGSDGRNSVRAYGYAFRGLTPVRHTLRVGGKRISAIGVMTTGGIEDAHIVEGGVNGDMFENFVRRSLLPVLQPFNESNPCSVVILDNASIHHLEHDIITEVGSLIRFKPPYSPDLMPLEDRNIESGQSIPKGQCIMHHVYSQILEVYASTVQQNVFCIDPIHLTNVSV